MVRSTQPVTRPQTGKEPDLVAIEDITLIIRMTRKEFENLKVKKVQKLVYLQKFL